MIESDEINIETVSLDEKDQVGEYQQLYQEEFYSFATIDNQTSVEENRMNSSLLKSNNCDQIKISVSEKQIPIRSQSEDESSQPSVARFQSASPTFDKSRNEIPNILFGSHDLLLRNTKERTALVETDQSSSIMPDVSMPQHEKKELLRKYSAPLSVDESNTFSKRPLKLASLTDFRLNLSDQYKCSICHNPFSDPRVLDCLHTFCLECIFDLVQSSKSQKSNVSQGHSVGESSEVEYSGTSESSIPKSISMISLIDSGEHIRKSKSRNSLPNFSGVQFKNLFRSNSANRNLRRKTSCKQSSGNISDKSGDAVKCPQCEFITDITFGSINRLPRHLLLQKKLQNELNKLQMVALTSFPCELCAGEQAITHCCTCDLKLCKTCEENHLLDNDTSMHNIIKLREIDFSHKMNSIEETGKKRTVKCYIHPTQELKLYCTTCNQVACTNCTVILHKGHKLEPVFKASKANLKLVRDALERNRQLTDYSNDSISRLNGVKKKIDSKAVSIQNEVEGFLQQYFEALEAHKRTLLKQIAKAKETSTSAIIENQKVLKERSFDTKKATVFAEELLADGNDIEVLALAGILMKRFEYFQKSNVAFEHKLTDSLRFLPDVRAPETQKQNNIPMYGIIATRTAVAKFCSLETEEPIILRVHRKAEIKVLSRDIDDKPLCHGGLQLKVEVKYQDSVTRTLTTQIQDERDGTYNINFTPDAAGRLVMTVKIQDKDIKGSPFNIMARTLRPHSGIYHCCTFCSSSGSKATVCACDSKMPGGYMGCGHGHEGHPGRRHWSCCASTFESSECTATNSFHSF